MWDIVRMEPDDLATGRESGIGGELSRVDRDTSAVPTTMGEEAADAGRAIVPSQERTLTGVEIGNTEGTERQAIMQAIRTLQVRLAELDRTLDVPQMDDIALRNSLGRDDRSTGESVHSDCTYKKKPNLGRSDSHRREQEYSRDEMQQPTREDFATREPPQVFGHCLQG